ncbi:MAG: lipid kinase [Microcoleus sp. PH2017_29_MFU_D_A]|uniref:lipid kinase n=1 Tax=unclassified Microcoleus TaxID=2642155 RepID=UPI001D5BD14F|nr:MULTISPECIES: lipid kinase [unclassified Microcoleus]MCC3429539.1 lipid kinase [Microcoleus sp. PH2017_04_SCI_O_A]MCC3466381.1 lipid kinase [Microcoleus sp. PH2017_06_SFM_O_A]MCC3501748.1 lipid kinase [Microcoleus sp. PH2017_19_SFW_U_A]TAF87049.1 MAG: lipid kinase [Oscillatoriales cyanobacterium]MCC3410198.1 lipid kinase [Microcoleus sp. PH2017_02_FOX_O_A]
MKKALLLVNQHSRKGQNLLSQATVKLQALGFDLIVESTNHANEISETIRHYQHQVELVIIGGGDGTLNCAIEGLIDTKLPLGILPMGTANDLARTLEIPTDLSAACQVIASGKIRLIDLGWVNGQHFFNVASLGLSVQITQRLTKDVKQRWGVLAYAFTALQTIWESRPFRAEIKVNNQSFHVKTIQIAIGNGRYYGGGMTVAEDATIDDRRLDLYSLETKNWWEIIALLPAMRQGNHNSWPNVRALHAQEIEINTSKRRPINTDGEITTQTPAKFRVIPQALAVIAPA